MGARHSSVSQKSNASTSFKSSYKSISFKSFKSNRSFISSINMNSVLKLKQKEELIVKIMMPLYYVEEPITFSELYDAKKVWDMVMNNTSPQFEAMKNELPYSNCREWFEKAFYQRLFNVHPFSKSMFRDPDVQGKFIVSLFTFVFTIMDDQERFNVRLAELAESHAKRGIKSSEYSIIGEVMFWTLKTCLGSAYDSKAHVGWVKIFSHMLKVIVPISVSLELKDNRIQKERLEKFDHSSTMKAYKSDKGDCPVTCPFPSGSINDQVMPKEIPPIKVIDLKPLKLTAKYSNNWSNSNTIIS